MLQNVIDFVLRPSKAPTASRPAARYRPQLEVLEDRVTPSTLPTGFSESLIASGIPSPTAMEFNPDGRLFVLQQNGQVRIITSDGTLLGTPFISFTVDPTGERGLLGIAFDPDFANNNYVYFYRTVVATPRFNEVVRVTARTDNPNLADTSSVTQIFQLDNLSGATNHNGGAIHFGPDGKLYIAVGENANAIQAQSLSTTHGKILRINSDGSIPTDNPFYNETTGNNRAIWALGLRNPFTFAFQPGTGRMFINDVGQNTREEFSEGVAGTTYGWPFREGDGSGIQAPPAGSVPTDFREPLHAYPRSQGQTIAGGAFYNPPSVNFPEAYLGDYFFADFGSRRIWNYDPETGAVSDFATNVGTAAFTSVVDLKVAADGSLYFLIRGNNASPAEPNGQVWRVTFDSGANSAPTLSPIGDQAVPSTQDVIDIVFSASDPNGDSLTTTALVQNLAYALDERLALFSSGEFFENYGGRNERWVQGVGGTWYFILPNGELYLWDRVADSANGAFVATVGAGYYGDPSLLYLAFEAGDLDRSLGLFTSGDLFENFFGAGEKWFQDSTEQWYFTLPNGEIYQWDGADSATGALVATLTPSFHASPSAVYNGYEARATVSISSSTLSIDREDGFIGSFYVTLTVSDGQLADRKYFTVAVTS